MNKYPFLKNALLGCYHLSTSYSLKMWTPSSFSSSPVLSDLSIHLGVHPHPMIFFIHSYCHTTTTTTNNNIGFKHPTCWPPLLISKVRWLFSLQFLNIFRPPIHWLYTLPQFLHSPTTTPLSSLSTVSRENSMDLSPLKRTSTMYSPVKNLTLVKANCSPFPVVGETKSYQLAFLYICYLKLQIGIPIHSEILGWSW